MTKPLCIDLFCGLGGWTEGFLAEGWDVIGFDIERHRYPIAHIENDDGAKLPPGNGAGAPRLADRPIKRLADAAKGCEAGWQEYPAQLVLQDIFTIHGSQFKTVDCIVASPPCQEFSYMAMPWSKAKAKERDLLEGRDDPKRLTALFDACFRIQREAIEAAGHFIPLVVENVRGAQKWVGRSRWNYGSYHLWGDVPALMPMTRKATKYGDGQCPGNRFDERPAGNIAANREHTKVPGFRFDGSGKSFQTASVDNFGWSKDSAVRNNSSKSNARKAASAAIAQIPYHLAVWIAKYWYPR